MMTPEVEERPRLVTGGYYGRHRRQWVNKGLVICILECRAVMDIVKVVAVVIKRVSMVIIRRMYESKQKIKSTLNKKNT